MTQLPPEDLALTPGGELVDVHGICPFCGLPVDKDDHSTWKEVRGWVGGPRKDSMRLRQDTGYYAHDECVGRAQAGLTPEDSASLFDKPAGGKTTVTELPEELRP